MKTSRFLSALLILLASFLPQAVAQTDSLTKEDRAAIRTAVDLIRADLKSEKAVILAQNIEFTAEESAEFWPLYNEYNAALTVLLDERLKLIKEFLDMHGSTTDAQATVLAEKVFALESKRTELKRTWFKKFTEVVPAKKAAQFFQIENQINAAVDLSLMDALPLLN